MGQNYVDDLLILYTAVRRIGYDVQGCTNAAGAWMCRYGAPGSGDLCRSTALSVGCHRAVFGSMPNSLFNRWAFMPSGAGHGRASFFWCFVLSNSFLSAFAPPGRSHQSPVLAVWMVGHFHALWVPTNTPCNLVRLTFGFGTREASFAMKSRGSNMMWMDARMPRSAWMRASGHMGRARPKALAALVWCF
jgi:hypothetical protein